MYIMKRPIRGDDGNYHINGKKYMNLFGSRQQVWNGNAYKTVGCLKKTNYFIINGEESFL